MVTRRLEVVISGDNKGARKAVQETEKDADGLGSKIKSALGSAPALIGAAAIGAVAGIGVAIKGAYDAAAESAKISRETERVIRTTGGAANVTATHIGDLAGSISDLTGADDELVQSTANLLLTFTNVKNTVGEGNDVFDQATGLALDMATVMGTDASGAAVQLGKALNDPIKGITALSKAGVSFTEEQKEQIKVLVENGDVLGAQKIILAELSKEFGGAAAAASTPLDRLMVKLGNFQEEIGARLIPIVDSASGWLMDTLPAAFDASTAHLDGLISVLTPVAEGAFDKVSQAVHMATGFLSEHTEIMKLLATVVLVDLGQKLGSATIAFMRMAAGNVISAVTDRMKVLVEYLTYARGAFLQVAASQGVMTAAGQTLSYVLSSAAARVMLATAAIYAFTTQSDQGREAAEKFAGSLRVSGTDAAGAEQDIGKMVTRMHELAEAQKTGNKAFGDQAAELFDILVPLHDVENSLHDQNDEWERSIELYKQARTRVDDQNRAFGALADKINATQSETGGMTMATGNLILRLQEMAKQEKIDVLTPDGPQRLQDLVVKTQHATTSTLIMSEAQEKFNDVAATAKDKVDAYKQSLDALMGIHLDAAQAETQYSQNSLSLLKTLVENRQAANGVTDASRSKTLAQTAAINDNNSAIQANVDSALNLSSAIYQETGSLDLATGSLTKHRGQLYETMRATGYSETAANAYIDRLGMTPANIQTQVNLQAHDAQWGLFDVQNRMHDVGRGVNGVATMDTYPARLALYEYQLILNRFRDRGGITSVIGGSITNIEHRAGGGPVSAGHPYIVGENGPEMFVAPISGQIIPNSDGGTSRMTAASGPVVVNVYVPHGYVGNNDEVGRAIARDLTDAARRGAPMPWD